MTTKNKRQAAKPDNVVEMRPADGTPIDDAVATPASTLTAEDHAVILNIFDAMSQRGAFKGSEMSSVGQIYDRVQSAHSQMTKQNAK